jgi:hypothetical protein
MATTTPKKRTSSRSTARKSNNARKRATKKTTSADQSASETPTATDEGARRLPSGLPEQLMIVIGAIVFGLVGLFVHVLFVVSLVLMALLLGLLASEARGQRGRGIVAEVVNEAKVVIDEVKKPGSADTPVGEANSTEVSD